MKFSLIAKVVLGFAVAGGIVSTPFLLSKNSFNSKEVVSNRQNSNLDRGKFHLEQKFSSCDKIYEDKTRGRTQEQIIYLCPLKYDNFELIYYSKESEGVEISEKIKSLEQQVESSYLTKLKMELENTGIKAINWPPLLFDYTPPSSSERTSLMPEDDCKLTSQDKPMLFECNDIWKVIKPKGK